MSPSCTCSYNLTTLTWMQSRLVYPLSMCRIGNIRPSQFEIFERTFARGIGVLQFTCRSRRNQPERADSVTTKKTLKINYLCLDFLLGLGVKDSQISDGQEVLTRYVGQ